MPIDPEIPLGVNTTPVNPLAQIGALAQTQNAINQSRQFQAQFSAKQRAGEIIASAPDIETGLQGLMKDPLTAAYAPDLINTYRQAQLTQTEIAGKQQSQQDTGLTGAIRLIGSAATTGDPDLLQQTYKGILANMPASIRSAVTPGLNSVLGGILAKVPSAPDPGEDPQAYTARRASAVKQGATALMLGSGLPVDQMQALVGGKPGQTINTGESQYLTNTGPLGTGGLPQVVGTAANTLPPTVLSPGPYGPGGAQTQPIIGGGGGGGLSLAGGSPPAPGISPAPVAPVGRNPLLGPLGGQPGMQPNGAPAGAPGGGNPLLPFPARPASSSSPGFSSGPVGAPPGTVEEANTRSNKFSDWESGLNEKVSGAQQLMDRLNFERKVLSGTPDDPGVAIGGWGEGRAKLAQALQGAQHAGVPIPPSWVEAVGNKNLSNSQVFTMLSAQSAAQNYQQAAVGAGLKKEYETFADTNPNLATDPRAAEKFLNFVSGQTQVLYNQQQDLAQFRAERAQGLHPGQQDWDFPAWESAKRFRGGAAFAPQSGYAAGSAAAAPTHRWNPQTGQIEPVPGGQ